MKILIYGINYAPELTGIGKYTGEMAEWLASHGHEICVVTAPPYYPQWHIAAGYSAWRYKRESIDGIKVYRCPLWVPKALRTRHRIGHLLSFACSSAPVVLWQALRWNPNLVIVIQPPLLAAPIAYIASRLAGAKVWMHIQDFELDAAIELGMMNKFWFKSILRVFERFFLCKMDCVSTISSQMVDHLATKDIKKEARVLFTNWVDTLAIHPIEEPSPYRETLGLKKIDIVALYAGNMGRKQGLEVLLEAARRLQSHSHLKIIMSGEGSMRETLQQAATDLKNVIFLPLQPLDRLNDLLNLADIHLLLQRSEASSYVMPSKLTGMLASGRPVIATVLPETELAKSLMGCGIVVPPNDPKALAEAILHLGSDGELRRRLGVRARELAIAHWDKSTVLQEFENHLAKHGGEIPHATFVAS